MLRGLRPQPAKLSVHWVTVLIRWKEMGLVPKPKTSRPLKGKPAARWCLEGSRMDASSALVLGTRLSGFMFYLSVEIVREESSVVFGDRYALYGKRTSVFSNSLTRAGSSQRALWKLRRQSMAAVTLGQGGFILPTCMSLLGHSPPRALRRNVTVFRKCRQTAKLQLTSSCLCWIDPCP